ncbi:MAG: hypothetical protein V1731_01165 [Candidatus Aenigmatarchaeota archaeon]
MYEDVTWIAIALFVAFLGFLAAGLNAITLFLAALGIFLLLFLSQVRGDSDVANGIVAIIILLAIPFVLFSIDAMRVVYLIITVLGLLTAVFFYKVGEFEVRSIGYAGVIVGLALTLVGIYLMLF